MRGTSKLVMKSRITVAMVAFLLVAGAGMALSACAANAGLRGAASNAAASSGLRGVVASVNVASFSFVLMAPRSGASAGNAGAASVTVSVSPQTTFRGALHSLADLQTGMTVTVQGAVNASGGTLTATEVDDQPENNDANDHADAAGDDNGSELDGAVNSVDMAGSSFMLLLAGGALKTITVSSATEFEGGLRGLASLTHGQRVSVKGTPQANGSVAASRVEAEDDQEAPESVDIAGVIASVDTAGSSFVLTVAGGGQGTVVVNAGTEFDGGFNGFSDLQKGMRVEVRGALQADGSVLASRVHREDSGGDGGDQSGQDGSSGDSSGDSGGDSGNGSSGSGGH